MKDEIFDILNDLKERLSSSLISDKEFQSAITKMLDTAGILGGRICVTVKDKMNQVLSNYLPSDTLPQPQEAERTNSEQANSAVNFSMEASFESDSPLKGQKSQLFRLINDVIELHWSRRDTLVLLPRVQDSGVETLAMTCMQKAANEHSCVGLLQLDLDNFGELNKGEKGGSQSLGDSVLREFAKRVRDHFSTLGVVLRSGAGDEFSAILAAPDSTTIISGVEKFRALMATTPFEAIESSSHHAFPSIKTCSIGLVIYTNSEEILRFPSFAAAFKSAASAQLRAKADGKNRIRLSAASACTKKASLSATELGRSGLLARCDIHRESATSFRTPFANAIADVLTTKVSGLSLANCWSTISEVYEKLGVEIVDTPTAAKVIMPEIIASDWLGLCARALLRAAYTGSSMIGERDELALHANTSQLMIRVHRTDGTSLDGYVGQGISPMLSAEIRIGEPWYDGTASSTAIRRSRTEESGSGGGPGALSPCLLLPIGDDAIDLAKRFTGLVADIVEIDDRPVTGGGLPDFWQSNIARVIRVCLANPNIETVVAVGKTEHAAATLEGLLDSSKIWSDLSSLSRHLGIQQGDLVKFIARPIVVQTVAANESDVVDALLEATRTIRNRDLSEAEPIDISTLSVRRRHLKLSQSDEESRLLRIDGLRARALSEAYPRVIQTFREYDQHIQQEPSGRQFKEFVCFKVHLAQAQLDPIPDYWRAEKASLDQYFNRNFLDAGGIFAARLNHKVDNMTVVDASVAAVVSAIKEAKPTRRILLPVARVAESLADVTQPLGLTAVQLLPRIRAGRVVIDFTWIWRTVEVLVGFPFSAYGSVRFSQHYLELVRSALGAWAMERAIEFGDLNYVALSLHMFQDMGDLEIARAIVVDAAD